MDTVPGLSTRYGTVVQDQQVQSGPSRGSQPRGRVRRDGAFLIHDQADAVGRHADRLRQAVDADLFILQVWILPG